MSEELAIELFNLAIEEEQQHARNEGLDKIDMMPVKSEWENMGEEDKDYWREYASKVEIIFNKLDYHPRPTLTLISDEEFLDWCGKHIVKGCGKTRKMADEHGVIIKVLRCEDCRAQAQLDHDRNQV